MRRSIILILGIALMAAAINSAQCASVSATATQTGAPAAASSSERVDAPKLALPAGVELLNELDLDQQNLLGMIKQAIPAFSKGVSDAPGEVGTIVRSLDLNEFAACIEGIKALRVVHFKVAKQTDTAQLLPQFESQVPESKGWKRIIYSSQVIPSALVTVYSREGKSFLGLILPSEGNGAYASTEGFVDISRIANWTGKFIKVMNSPRGSAQGSQGMPGSRATIVLQADPKPGDRWPADPESQAEIMQEVKQVLMKRIAGIPGVTEPSASISGSNAVVVTLVTLPGAEDVQSVIRTLSRAASLEFYLLKNVKSVRNPSAKWRMDLSGQSEKTYTFTGPKGQVLSTAKPSDMPKIMSEVVGAPKVAPVITGADLLPNAKSSLNQYSMPTIEIAFSEQGTRKFADFTRSHVNEYTGIFFDGRLLTAPVIKEPITGGTASIQGFKSLKDAADAANFLNAGSLPVHLKAVGGE